MPVSRVKMSDYVAFCRLMSPKAGVSRLRRAGPPWAEPAARRILVVPDTAPVPPVNQGGDGAVTGRWPADATVRVLGRPRPIAGVDRGGANPYGPGLFEVRIMKVRNSIRSAKLRERNCRVVRRKGRLYVINKRQPRFKVRQG